MFCIKGFGFLPDRDNHIVGSFFGLCLGVALDFGKVIPFAPSLGTSLISKGSYAIPPEEFKVRRMYPKGKKQIENNVFVQMDQSMMSFQL